MTPLQPQEVSTEDVARVLRSMAGLMEMFRQQDLALQDSLSSLSARARATSEMGTLQHVDLITQTHVDLANLLPKLAAALKGEAIEMDVLKNALSLRSLQDTLIDGIEDNETQAGDLALF